MDQRNRALIPMIIFYYGNDAYRVVQAGTEVIDRYQAKYPSGLNLFRIDATSPDAMTALEDVLRNNSFFQEVKLVVITQTFMKKSKGDDLIALFEKYDLPHLKEVVVSVCASEERSALLKIDKALFAYLEKHAQPVKELATLAPAQQVAWIQKECQERGVVIATSEARGLIQRLGNDSWALAQAIEKLANYRQKGTITFGDIELLTSTSVDQNIFALVDAIAAKNKPLAIELLTTEMGSGRDPHYILSMIIFQFRNLLTIKDLSQRTIASGELARKSGLAPFVVKKTEHQAHKFSLQELSDAFSRLATLDIAAKQGLAYLEDELMNLILRQA